MAARLAMPQTLSLALVVVAVLVMAATLSALRWASAGSAAQPPSVGPAGLAAAPSHTAPGPDATPRTSPSPAPVASGEPAPVVRRRAAAPKPVRKEPVPVRLRMGEIDIDLRVRPVGVREDAQMALPAKPWVLGWYRYGPAPGAGGGSAVLAGHLDSLEYGIGPLVRLRDADRGDLVIVTRADGSKVRYRIDEVERYDQEKLPDSVFARTGAERLRIVTCGGEFDRGKGYEKNLVVTAVPVG